MSEYTVHFVPSDPVETGATVTVRLAPDGPEIREIDVRIGSDAAPFPESLSQLDFQSLIAAVVTLSRGSLSGDQYLGSHRIDPFEPVEAEPHERPGAIASGASPRSSVKPATPARRGRKKRSGTEKSDAPSDLAMMYWKLGTTSKVATHYSVPRQIAQRWIQSLRKGGALPDPWRQERTRSGARKNEGR